MSKVENGPVNRWQIFIADYSGSKFSEEINYLNSEINVARQNKRDCQAISTILNTVLDKFLAKWTLSENDEIKPLFIQALTTIKSLHFESTTRHVINQCHALTLSEYF